MSEPILKVENMNKRFGSTVALKDVSLSVYPGGNSGINLGRMDQESQPLLPL